ncbi:MAG: tetratricopeptide repeat protein, partial [Sedimentisphaerales bacterium]|nr:tetratricopeptide repeat protein [Sedimentisphaerales bacterium]
AQATPAELLQQARQQQNRQQYDQAALLYQTIMAESPDTDAAREAAVHLAAIQAAGGQADLARELMASIAAAENHTVEDIVIEDPTVENPTVADPTVTDTSSELIISVARWLAYDHLALQRPVAVLVLYLDWLKDRSQDAAGLWLAYGTIQAALEANDPNAALIETARIQQEFSEHEDIAEVLVLLAETYRTMEQYPAAMELYRYVVELYPDRPDALAAQEGLIRTHLELAQDEQVQTEVLNLLGGFTQHPDRAERITLLAADLQARRQYESARWLYQSLLETSPPDTDALRLWQGWILCGIYLEDDEAVAAGVQQLQKEFSGHPDLAEALFEIARAQIPRWPDQARQLFEAIPVLQPQDEYAILARAGQGSVLIRQGDEKLGGQICQEVLTAHAQSPRLPEAMGLMAGGYYDRAMIREKDGGLDQAADAYRRAIALWDQVLSKLDPADPAAAAAAKMAGDCYRRLGQYDLAIGYYRTILESCPQYPYAWHAQFLVGHCLEQLYAVGVTVEPDTAQAIRLAYERLIEHYADCPAVAAARIRLQQFTPSAGEVQ